MTKTTPLTRACLAETLGTFVLVFFGLGAVHVALLFDVLAGLWQIACVWGAAVALAIYATGSASGAHLNPAITLAFAVWRGFAWRRVVPYVLAQGVGAFLAAAALYGLFGNAIAAFEQAAGLVRGAAGSQLSAMFYGMYFPNPADVGVDAQAFSQVTLAHAIFAEIAGTAALAFAVFALTDDRNPVRPHGALVPLAIGMALAMIITVIAPLTQAGLNPARDLGPRLVTWLVGWGEIAFPGPRGGFFWVYTVAPLAGALLGGAISRYLLFHSDTRRATTLPLPPTEAQAESRTASAAAGPPREPAEIHA